MFRELLYIGLSVAKNATSQNEICVRSRSQIFVVKNVRERAKYGKKYVLETVVPARRYVVCTPRTFPNLCVSPYARPVGELARYITAVLDDRSFDLHDR